MTAWFISDIHLKGLNERNGNILLRFLHSIIARGRAATHLFLLGDIFDLWIGPHQFYYKKYKPIVDAIFAIRGMGIEVVYFEGNHDMHMQEFWEKEFGIPCLVKEKYFQLGNFLVRCEHGDFINPDDIAYKRYRSVVRHPVVETIAHKVPGKIFNEIGEALSLWSRTKSGFARRDKADKIRQMIRDYAEHSFTTGAFDFLVTGHMHVRDDWEFSINGRSARSVNLGSWFQEPAAFCIDDNGGHWVDLKPQLGAPATI